MTNAQLEEFRRELVENKLNRYDSSNKEQRHEGRQLIKNPNAQSGQKDRHVGISQPEEARRLK